MKTARIGLAFIVGLGGCFPVDDASSGGEREVPVTRITPGRAGEDNDPEVSGDGTTLFYASTSFSRNADLYFRRIGGNTATRLTMWPGNERFPKVNPADPRMLAFCSDRRGQWEIYVIPDYRKAPEEAVAISEPGTQNIHPSWSPDGSRLVYCSTTDFGKGEWVLKVYTRSSGTIRVLEGVDGLLPEWSPRGNRIVFQRMKHRDDWLGSLWMLELEGDDAHRVNSIFSSDDWAAINPSWSPNGEWIVFTTVAKSRARSGILHEGDDIWTVTADGSHPTRLTSSPSAEWMPTWSRDGRIYFVSDRTGTHRIWSLRPALVDLSTPARLREGEPVADRAAPR